MTAVYVIAALCVGGVLGVLASALCVAAARGDDHHGRTPRD